MDGAGTGDGVPPRSVDTAAVTTGGRRWRSLVFAPVGDGQRRRRGSDGLRVVAAVAGLACCLLVIGYGYRVDRAVTRVVNPPPASLGWLVTAVYYAGGFGAAGIVLLLAVVARRWVVARDIGASVLGTAAVTGLLILLLGGDGGRGSGNPISGYPTAFPVFPIALVMAIATAGLPYLARTLQRLVQVSIGLAVAAAIVDAQALPVNVVGSLLIGWGATAVVHLVFGSPLGLGSAAGVARLLDELGIHADHVRRLDQQEWGVARYTATTKPATTPDGGGTLTISVYGRDAADAKLLSKTGRFLLYRDSGPTLTFTRLQQVEHEAFLTLRARQLGVAVPEIVEAAAAGPARDALLVSRLPAATPLSTADPDKVTNQALDQLFTHLLTLRAARLAHGEINGDTILIDRASRTVYLTTFRNATTTASRERLDRDLAGAIAATALVVGADRATAAADRCLDAEVMTGVLAHLRRASLDPTLARALRRRTQLLDEVRGRSAHAKGIDVPKLIEPRRISWPTLIMAIGTVIGGWALIGVLIDVTRSFDTIVGANWAWVVVVFLLAQLAVTGSAIEDLGSVPGELPFNRVIVLEMANGFSAIAGGTAAVFATRVRFFQQQGYDAATALSSSGSVTAASWVVKTLLFLISLPLAWSTINLEPAPESGGNADTVWLILAAVIVLAVAVGLVLSVPKLRHLTRNQLRPRLTVVWANARAVARSPVKLTQLLAGALIGQLAVTLALAGALRAIDDHLSLATLIIIISLAGIIGGVSPVPGGIGVVEAGLILGLTAAGISEADATAAVFLQRLFTSYLPPLWGWFSLIWMRRHDYI